MPRRNLGSRSRSRSPDRLAQLQERLRRLERRFQEADETLEEHGGAGGSQAHSAEELSALKHAWAGGELRLAMQELRAAREGSSAEAPEPQQLEGLRRAARLASRRAAEARAAAVECAVEECLRYVG